MRLIRYEDDGERTFGVLVLPGVLLHTLERPWLDNRRNVSCIPPGTYPVEEAKSRKLNAYHDGHVFAVRPVPGRSYIRIHCGNYVDQVRGCILVGLGRGSIGADPAVIQSRMAYTQLLNAKREDTLEVIDATGG